MRTPARLLTVAILAVGIFCAGYLASRQKDPATSFASSDAASGYSFSMHPQYKSDHNRDCPVCGMTVDPKAAGTLKTEYKGKTYYFCSDRCRKSFEANPGKYVSQKTAAGKAEQIKDPVCGMTVDPKAAGTLKTEYKGKTYYFCSDMCRKSFEANPGKYVRKMADADMHGMPENE